MQEINDKHILWDEQIDKFLRNQMTAEEEKVFLKEMETDKEMKSYVTTTTLLLDGIRKQAKQSDEVTFQAAKNASKTEIYTAAGKKMSVGKKIGNVIQMNKWMSSVAAVAAVFVCLFVLNHSYVNEGAIRSASGISSSESYMRGGENEALQVSLARIYNNVDAGKYMTSNIVQLEEMYQKATDDITDDEDDFRYDIGLYLAKAYIMNDQKEDAENLLTEMHETYPKDETVSDLLHQLTKKFFWE